MDRIVHGVTKSDFHHFHLGGSGNVWLFFFFFFACLFWFILYLRL